MEGPGHGTWYYRTARSDPCGKSLPPIPASCSHYDSAASPSLLPETSSNQSHLRLQLLSPNRFPRSAEGEGHGTHSSPALGHGDGNSDQALRSWLAVHEAMPDVSLLAMRQQSSHQHSSPIRIANDRAKSCSPRMTREPLAARDSMLDPTLLMDAMNAPVLLSRFCTAHSSRTPGTSREQVQLGDAGSAALEEMLLLNPPESPGPSVPVDGQGNKYQRAKSWLRCGDSMPDLQLLQRLPLPHQAPLLRTPAPPSSPPPRLRSDASRPNPLQPRLSMARSQTLASQQPASALQDSSDTAHHRISAPSSCAGSTPHLQTFSNPMYGGPDELAAVSARHSGAPTENEQAFPDEKPRYSSYELASHHSINSTAEPSGNSNGKIEALKSAGKSLISWIKGGPLTSGFATGPLSQRHEQASMPSSPRSTAARDTAGGNHVVGYSALPTPFRLGATALNETPPDCSLEHPHSPQADARSNNSSCYQPSPMRSRSRPASRPDSVVGGPQKSATMECSMASPLSPRPVSVGLQSGASNSFGEGISGPTPSLRLCSRPNSARQPLPPVIS